jgi:hypothetical protein
VISIPPKDPDYPRFPDSPLKPEMIKCPCCGKWISPYAHFCVGCGEPDPWESTPEMKKYQEQIYWFKEDIKPFEEKRRQIAEENDRIKKEQEEEMKRRSELAREKEEGKDGIIAIIGWGMFLYFCYMIYISLSGWQYLLGLILFVMLLCFSFQIVSSLPSSSWLVRLIDIYLPNKMFRFWFLLTLLIFLYINWQTAIWLAVWLGC